MKVPKWWVWIASSLFILILAACGAEINTGTQMRLIIGETPDNGINILSESHPFGNYIIDTLNSYHELKVPSGYQTGIKIVHGFTISENQTTELILDFDASRSIVRAGTSGQWLLRPTIKVLDTNECSIVSGEIVDENGDPLEGVSVSAQIYDSEAVDLKDIVIIQTSTVTDEIGLYTIFLQPGTYNIVAYKDGYSPACSHLIAEPDTTYNTEDFSLTEASTGTVSGEVSIPGADPEQHVTLSFRQIGQCEGNDIEVRSLNVAKGGDYDVILPVGPHSIVASTDDRTTVVYEITVTDSGVAQNITL